MATPAPLDFRRFNFWVPCTKAVTADDGDWIVEGPLSNPDADLQGEKMDMGGLRKGLKVYEKLGKNVDWEHLYKATKDPKWLIGKGVAIYDAPHPKTGHMVPWLRTKLLKSKEIARNAVEHLRSLQVDCGEEMGLGYSVEGGVVRDQGTNLLNSIITMVTLTPQPVVAENAGTIRLVKSLTALQSGRGDWDTADFISVPQLVSPLSDSLLEYEIRGVLKALQASGETPAAGPGINAAEVSRLGVPDDDRGADEDYCPTCERTYDRCRCAQLQKALAYQLAEELALYC
jgi:hypothetical protein